MAHWSDRYVGKLYVAGEDDCAAWAARVQREVFGRDVVIPGGRPSDPAEAAALIAAVQAQHSVRVERPVEGDLVLMRRGALARPWHIGVWFERAHEGWILHAVKTPGEVISTRVRQLGQLGLQVEGYYRWI